jgi:hypothetical protein
VSDFFKSFMSPGLRDDFPSPWHGMAQRSMPTTYRNALDWSEYCFFANSTYARAQQRIVAYFLTEVEVSASDGDHSLGDDERSKWSTFLEEDAAVRASIAQLDMDTACYGNAYASLLCPFRRFLISQSSGIIIAFREMVENPKQFNLQYDHVKNRFMAKDPQSDARCEWKIHDVPYESVEIKIWNPKEIEVIFDPWTNNRRYLWRIPAHYKREVKRGNMHILESAPLEVLKAVAQDCFFLFSKDTIFHMMEPTLSGVDARGYGISRALLNYPDIWYVQVLRRFNEAIALDHVCPFRLITPDTIGAGTQGTAEPLRAMNMGDWAAQIRAMVRRRRHDPNQWNTLPFPVRYQSLGGDANQLATPELLVQGEDVMLNAAGAPAELYRGTLQMNVAPVALRLFESTHYNLVHSNNEFLRWFVGRVTQLLPLPSVRLKMRSVTYADDFQKQMAMLQMFMGQQVSGTTALRGFGQDWRTEQRQIAEEEVFRQKIRAELQEEAQTNAQGEQIAKGQPAPAGAGAAPGGQPADPSQQGGPAPGQPAVDPTSAGGSPVQSALASMGQQTTPDDLLQMSQSLAEQLLSLPSPQRTSELRTLKGRNEILHALVKAKVQETRNQARMAGGSMLMGEQPAG